jgi:hypothetical protein
VADPLEGVSPNGTLLTGAARARVAVEYEPALAAAAAGVTEPGREASLYLYGSVATGTAIAQHSDIDLLSIDLDPIRAAELASRLSGRFGDLCRSVDISVAAPTDFVGETDEAYGNRVFLRHYCVHLAGPSRHLGLADYPAGARAARGFNGDIAQHLERWRIALALGDDPGVIARKAARKTLLALAGIVSVTDHTWTTDRTHAADRWSELHPESAADVQVLAGWSSGTDRPSAPDVAAGLNGVIGEIVEEFSRTVGLWKDT